MKKIATFLAALTIGLVSIGHVQGQSGGIVHKDLGPRLRQVVPNLRRGSITSAQILALNATAQTLIPAPGPGRAIVVDFAKIQYIPGTAEYTITDGAGGSANAILNSVNLTNTSFSLTANGPAGFFPFYLTCAITDSTPSITAGTLTVVGKDQFGNTQSEVLNYLKLGLSSRAKSVWTFITSITSASFATLGGGGDETIVCGHQPMTAEDLALKYVSTSGQRIGGLRSRGFLNDQKPFDDDSISVSANLANAASTLTASTTHPADAFNVVVTVVDSTPSITTGSVAITGTGRGGESQTEVLAFTAAGAKVTTRPFTTVTAVRPFAFSVLGGGGDETIKTGTTAGAKIGVIDPEGNSQIPIENAAVVLAMDTGEVTVGTGTFRYELAYRIVPFNVDILE